MSEEEKETIKYIESGIDTYIENTKVSKIVISKEQAKILLNLIEKQEKVIDKLAEKLEEKSMWMIKSKWVLWAYKEVNRKVENDE